MKTEKKSTTSTIAFMIFMSVFISYCNFAIAQNSDKSVGKTISKELKNQDMVSKITRYEVKKEYQEEFQKRVKDYVLSSLSNDENIMSEAYFEQNDNSVIWLFERWTNQKGWSKFRNTSHSKALIVLAKVALVKPEKNIYVKDLEPISKEQ